MGRMEKREFIVLLGFSLLGMGINVPFSLFLFQGEEERGMEWKWNGFCCVPNLGLSLSYILRYWETCLVLCVKSSFAGSLLMGLGALLM